MSRIIASVNAMFVGLPALRPRGGGVDSWSSRAGDWATRNFLKYGTGLGDFAAGLANSVSFGAADKLIGATGLAPEGSTSSSAHQGGELAGLAIGVVELGATVGKLVVTRVAYGAAVRAIPGEASALASAVGLENAGRWAVAARNVAKAEARNALGWAGKGFDALSELTYGSSLGPTASEMYAAKGSWQAVISSAGKTSGFWDAAAATFAP